VSREDKHCEMEESLSFEKITQMSVRQSIFYHLKMISECVKNNENYNSGEISRYHAIYHKISLVSHDILYFILSVILQLSHVVGRKTVQRALHIIDTKKIRIYKSCVTQRKVAEVFGTEYKNGYKPVYLLFPEIPYCNCKSVMGQVVRAEKLCCKHFLAVNIAMILGKAETIEITKSEFLKIIRQIRTN
jgi:hypothetical protein